MDPNRPLVYSVGGNNYVKRQKTARNSKTAYIKKRTVLQQAWNNLLAKYTEEMCTWRTNSNAHVVSLDLLHSDWS